MGATDRPGFKMQTILLARLISLVESGSVQAPLYDPAKVTEPNMNNVTFLKMHISGILTDAFQHVQP